MAGAQWIPGTIKPSFFPNAALLAGKDKDGADIYAGRARHERDVLPAKLIPSKNECYVCYNGQEIGKDSFEALVPTKFTFVPSKDGQVPPGAFEAGVTASGEKLYIGRVTTDGYTTPGKVHPSQGCLYYPFGGKELSVKTYEILVHK